MGSRKDNTVPGPKTLWTALCPERTPDGGSAACSRGNAAGADRALVVTTPEVSAIRDADRIVGLLEASEFRQIDLIINRLRYDMVKRGEMMSSQDVVDILALNLIGIVPDDENVVIATNQGEPLVGDHTLAGRAYQNICYRVTGKEVPFLDLERNVSFWTKVSGIFHRN